MVTRDEVGAYKPYLWEQSTFHNGVLFREWILTKIVNGERASYSAPKFARMQERTRSQMLEDIVANLQNHAETGQIPKPYRYLYICTSIYIYIIISVSWELILKLQCSAIAEYCKLPLQYAKIQFANIFETI